MSIKTAWNRLVGNGHEAEDVRSPMTDEDRSAYLAAVAHDLKTPVTALYGYVRLLSEDHAAELSPDVREMLAAMDRNARRMRILVEQLLDVQLLEAGTVVLIAVPCEVGAVLSEAADEQQGEASRRGVTIRVETSPEVAAIVADPDRIHQIAYNLLRNALRFAPDASEVCVRVAAGPDGGLSFSVSDRGPGVPEGHREKVFERFYRMPGQAHHSGTGIGLSIVRELTALHGGSVRCAENPGGGALFTVALPAKPPAGN